MFSPWARDFICIASVDSAVKWVPGGHNLVKGLQSSVNYSKKAIKNHHGEVPVVVQKKKNKKNIKHLQYKQENKTKQKQKNNNNKKKTKLNFEPSTMYLCLGACTTVRVRSTWRLQCEMTQEMV